MGNVASGATLEAFTIAERVDSFWMNPMGSKTAFPSGTKLVWATVHVKEAPPGTSVAAVIFFQDGNALEKLTTIEQKVDGTRYVAFSLRNDAGFELGNYQVLFLLNGEEKGFANFSIAAGAGAGNPSASADREEGLHAELVGLAGIDAYGVLWPSREPIYYPGETIAFLLQNVGKFETGRDGRHWLDMDYRLTDADGAVISANDGILGESGRSHLPGGMAASPFVQFDQTARMPPGSYIFSVMIRDRIGGGWAGYSRAFVLADVEAELKEAPDGFALNIPLNNIYDRYIDPLRRFGVFIPKGWTPIQPEDKDMVLNFALDPKGQQLGLLKVHVHNVDDDGTTPAGILKNWKNTLEKAAHQGGAAIKFQDIYSISDFADYDLKAVRQILDMSMAFLEYSIGDGRRIAEIKTAIVVEDHVSILSFLAEEKVWRAVDNSEDLDWGEGIPASFQSITPHWAILRHMRSIGRGSTRLNR